MQKILRRVHDSADDGAAAMAEALGMDPGAAGGAAAADDGRDGSSGSGSASDEDEVLPCKSVWHRGTLYHGGQQYIICTA